MAPGGANQASELLVYKLSKPLVHELKEWPVHMLKEWLIHELIGLLEEDLEKLLLVSWSTGRSGSPTS